MFKPRIVKITKKTKNRSFEIRNMFRLGYRYYTIVKNESLAFFKTKKRAEDYLKSFNTEDYS